MLYNVLQIIIHLTIATIIISQSMKCDKENYRADAGLLAAAIAGTNLWMVGYLIFIHPKTATLSDYVFLAGSGAVLYVVARFKGNTATMIDRAKEVFS